MTIEEIEISLCSQLGQFIKSPLRNKWLETDQAKIFVRKSKRVVKTKLVDALDIASIEFDESIRSKGLFTRILTEFEHLNPFDYLYIENVLNPELGRFLQERGYAPIGSPVGYIKRQADCERKG